MGFYFRSTWKAQPKPHLGKVGQIYDNIVVDFSIHPKYAVDNGGVSSSCWILLLFSILRFVVSMSLTSERGCVFRWSRVVEHPLGLRFFHGVFVGWIYLFVFLLYFSSALFGLGYMYFVFEFIVWEGGIE